MDIGEEERERRFIIWIDTTEPETSQMIRSHPVNRRNHPKRHLARTGNTTHGNSTAPSGGASQGGGVITQQGSNGTYTQTETLITTETAGGWVTTYQTVVTRVYNERGVLLSTKKNEPVVLSRVKAGDSNVNAPDPGKIAATLNEEYARVSVGVRYKPELAAEVLEMLNEERIAEGMQPLTMNNSSDTYKLAQVRAADMAIYDHSDFDSPSYGLLSEMLSRFGIASAIPSENTWKTTASKNAGAIHTRFMVLESSRNALMNPNYTEIGIGIVQKNGYYYICEVLIA